MHVLYFTYAVISDCYKDLCAAYEIEDKNYDEWSKAVTRLYNAKLQPFVDMRELANEKMRYAKVEYFIVIILMYSLHANEGSLTVFLFIQ